MKSSSTGAVLYQSLLGGVIFLIAAALGWLTGHDIIVFPLGASIFIAFATPGSNSARPYSVIAGYLAGIASGLLAYWALSFAPVNWPVLAWLAGALAVVIAIVFMALIRAEHAPAAVMALSLVSIGFDRYYLLAVLGGVVALVLVSQMLRHKLVDLF